MPYDADYSDYYNTQLHPDAERQFQNWVSLQSAKTGRNVGNDLYDYDLRGWWLRNQNADLTGGHLTDDFKKPNHPTFSTQSRWHGVDGLEGGEWAPDGSGSWQFTPGATNLNMHGADSLRDYFKRVEPNSELILRGSSVLSDPLRSYYGGY